eukprot:6837835-Pyramimonas_sp.AAC.1
MREAWPGAAPFHRGRQAMPLRRKCLSFLFVLAAQPLLRTGGPLARPPHGSPVRGATVALLALLNAAASGNDQANEVSRLDRCAYL